MSPALEVVSPVRPASRTRQQLEVVAAPRPARRARQRVGPRWREWVLARQGNLGFAGVILAGALAALSAARTYPLLPESVRPVPSSLAGVFGQGGIDLGFGGMVVVLGLMFVFYVAMVRGADQLSARTVLTGVACLNLLVLLAPPMLSTDVFSYIAYGRIGAVYGSNPYLFGPSAIFLDPVHPYIGSQWVKTPTAYGPLFTGLSYLFAPLTIAANVIAYKAIAAVSSLVIVLVVWTAARLRSLNPVKAVALVGLNPVIVLYGVGGGHNDLLMLALMLTGIYVLLRQRQRASGALLVAAVAVKLTAGLMLPFALARNGPGRAGSSDRRALLTGAGITAGVVAVFSLAVFGTAPVHLIGTLQSIQSQGGLHSVPGLVLALLGHVALMSVIGLVLEAVLVACLGWLVWRVWRGELDWIRGGGWATVLILCTTGLLVPWYVTWLVPLAALTRDRRLLAATIVLTGVALTTL